MVINRVTVNQLVMGEALLSATRGGGRRGVAVPASSVKNLSPKKQRKR